jgi:negative regulator of genetic competence, sporulation and motility
MDLIKINDNKLKIMLTPVDMQSYDLRANELDCTNIETRQAFRSIMDEARSRTGFDAKGNQIYVQVYPSREGGCEMFVTKIGLLDKDNDHFEKDSAKEPILSEKITVKAKGEKSNG